MNWNNKREIVKEVEYTDGRWKMTEGDGTIFLYHADLLMSPCGSGTTQKEACAVMLKKIEEYAKTLARVKAELQTHLEALEAGK